MTTDRFYATRNDAGVPTVVDSEGIVPQEDMPGDRMWSATWTADHYNGKHEKAHTGCPVCNETEPQ